MNKPLQPTAKSGNYRWRILAMLFFALTINYFDRSLLGVMAPKLMELFEWTNKDYALVNMSFKAAYAIGLLIMVALSTGLAPKKDFPFPF